MIFIAFWGPPGPARTSRRLSTSWDSSTRGSWPTAVLRCWLRQLFRRRRNVLNEMVADGRLRSGERERIIHPTSNRTPANSWLPSPARSARS
jgi:hypothetical protein